MGYVKVWVMLLSQVRVKEILQPYPAVVENASMAISCDKKEKIEKEEAATTTTTAAAAEEEEEEKKKN